MSPPCPTVLTIKQWLSDQYIPVPMDWVQACVEFLNQEYKNPNLPLQRLKNHVYEQWLVADLEEIGVSMLPDNVCAMQKTSLSGFFTLQVNGIRDVGKPAYAQLRQLEGSENSDVEVSAAPKAFLPDWEAKPTRMLLLNLTDGVNCIQGMEYQPISSLSPNLPPGLKVLIKGPVVCRFGLLLLTADKIQVLGGSVDKLQQKYSREGILRDTLQISSVSESLPRSDETGEVNSDQRNTRNRSDDPTMDNRAVTESISLLDQNDYDEQENFECDDDFDRSLDHNALDEIERANGQQVVSNDIHSDNEDEDVLREMYEFQAKVQSTLQEVITPGNVSKREMSGKTTAHGQEPSLVESVSFTYLNCIPQDETGSKEFTLTIKGSVSKVLSRLECKAADGWHLTAKIHDSTSSLDVDFHDKVLEEFVGVSAKDMVAMQIQARENEEIKKRMMEAIGNCKKKLQELNCFMEIKFSPEKHPCVVKCIKKS